LRSVEGEGERGYYGLVFFRISSTKQIREEERKIIPTAPNPKKREKKPHRRQNEREGLKKGGGGLAISLYCIDRPFRIGRARAERGPNKRKNENRVTNSRWKKGGTRGNYSGPGTGPLFL